jgi:hypothetical protein
VAARTEGLQVVAFGRAAPERGHNMVHFCSLLSAQATALLFIQNLASGSLPAWTESVATPSCPSPLRFAPVAKMGGGLGRIPAMFR